MSTTAISRPTPRNARGFTLIEVMVTLVILAFGLLALAAMQLVALKQGSAGRHTGDGAAIARSYLEQAVRIPWTDLTAAAGGGWIDPAWAGLPSADVDINLPGGGSSTEHAYTVQWRVTDVGVAPICLRDVEVRVSWQEDGFSVDKTQEVGTRRYNQGDPNC
jgi:prepilin-type N-terminal cleavage/methylation domain-containing protein